MSLTDEDKQVKRSRGGNLAKPELQIAKDLALPLDAVTQTFGILAIKRAGKSYCARRFTEQFHKAGQQVVIVDPKGDWWGIRSSTDGRAGYTPGGGAFNNPKGRLRSLGLIEYPQSGFVKAKDLLFLNSARSGRA